MKADSRLASITRLKSIIGDCESHLVVLTAGSLRDGFEFVEQTPLIDQGYRPLPRPTTEEKPVLPRVLTGDITLSPREHKNLFRTILILDAVVRGWDKSGASLRAWRNIRTQPLKAALRKETHNFPELSLLILSQKTGVRLEVERLAEELCIIWNELHPTRYSAESVMRAIRQYFPIAATLPRDLPIQEAFGKARPLLRVDAA